MKEVSIYDNSENLKGIRLNGNESYMSISEENLFEIVKLIKDVELNRYPDTEGVKVREAYAKYAKVKAENIIMGNGSDEMLGLVIGAIISKGKKILSLDPDFSMYDFYATLNDGEIIKYKVCENGSFKVEDFIEIGIKKKVDLIMFSNPNNPTGFSLCNEDIIKILKAFPNTKTVVDEAYYEFNKESIVGYINEYSNLLVTRTLSKAWGLAAIRVGFLIGNEDAIKQLSDYKVPYNVNSLSQIVAENILKDIDRVKKNSDLIIVEREKLFKSLKLIEIESSLVIKFYKSSANYIFGRSDNKDILIKALNSNGIIIRSFKDDSFRITVGSEVENNKLLEIIRQTFVYNGGEI